MASRTLSTAERIWLVVLAIIGAGIATYLARYQLGFAPAVWDPVFGPVSTEAVLHSGLARSLPVPDAGLGVVAYVLEGVLAALTGMSRVGSSLWLDIAFAAVVVGLAVGGVGLLLVQIAFVHAMCTLCLVSAVISWINAALSRGHIAATAHRLQPMLTKGHP
jgi:uncharacterized membrane protein